MQVRIRSTQNSETATIEQMLNFYQSRLDDRVSLMEINLSKRPLQTSQTEYNLALQANLVDGQQIEMKEYQSDLMIATQRLFDRLDRRLQIWQQARSYSMR